MPLDEVERTIARARRSRDHVLRVLDAIERTPALAARSERAAGTMRISIVLASLTTGSATIAVAHNLNRPINDAERSGAPRGRRVALAHRVSNPRSIVAPEKGLRPNWESAPQRR